LTRGGEVLGSPRRARTISGSALPADLANLEPSASGRIRLGGEEFVAATLPLGVDRAGAGATLVLLRPLGPEVSAASRSLLLALLACGILALLFSGLMAWRVSRSVLDPLERFVAFVREVALSGGHSRPFEGSEESAEVRTLNSAFHLLMESLQEHEKRVLLNAREEMVRVERLKESEKLASLGRMLSGAAHEINNPLTGVVGNLDILLRGGTL